MDILIVSLDIIVILLLIAVLIKLFSAKATNQTDNLPDMMKDLLGQSERNMRSELSDNIKNMSGSITELMKINTDAQNTKLNDTDSQLNLKISELRDRIDKEMSAMQKDTAEKLEAIRITVDEKMQRILDDKMNSLSSLLTDNQKQAGDAQHKQLAEMSSKIDQNINNMNRSISEKQEQSGKAINDSLKNLESRFATLEKNNEQKLENMRTTMSRQLTNIQEENQKKLDSIQNTVNEKLESRLQKSFETVSKQLETVHKSLGEMQSIAAGVGDLKKVLSNVKTRGILGEIQLGNILEEILAPEQYDREIATVKGSRDHVEYAIKLPGQNERQFVYLPIDSKFPGDTYQQLVDAQETGSKELVEVARKNLIKVIKECAKSISAKYISPPYTTNFAIMFLPFEGLYAEVVNLGLIETLQNEYHISITGPSTMAAMLNSLQMGFKTLAIQKKSSEVWQVLGGVKKEFATFQETLDKAQKQIQNAGENLDKLIGTRTRAINRRLSSVEVLDDLGASAQLTDDLGGDM